MEPMLPLINVVFLLLIFFLVAGNPQMPLDSSIVVPQKSAEDERIAEAADAWVYLKKDGALYYQQRPVAALSVLTHFPAGELVLFADGQLQGAELARVLNELLLNGLTKVSIISERVSDDEV